MRFMGNAKLVPQQEKAALVRRKVLTIRSIVHDIPLKIAARGVIHVTRKVRNQLDILSNPSHQAIEGDKDASRRAISEADIMINMLLMVDSNNLLDLPEWTDWEDAVGVSYI